MATVVHAPAAQPEPSIARGAPGGPSRGAAPGSSSRSRTGSRPRSTRQKSWRKLLWVDSSFLNQLQCNVNVHPYDFWPLVAESTVITEHLSSMVIFITCFIAIFIERASPVVVTGGSSALTVLGYWVWDMGWEQQQPAEGGVMNQGLGACLLGSLHTPSHSPARKKNYKPNAKNTSRASSPNWNTK